MDKPKARFNFRLAVTLTFEECGRTSQGISQNISETGVLIHSSTRPTRGAVARLEFEEFEAEAEVVWTKETDYGRLFGMRFLSMGWGDRSALTGLFELMEEYG